MVKSHPQILQKESATTSEVTLDKQTQQTELVIATGLNFSIKNFTFLFIQLLGLCGINSYMLLDMCHKLHITTVAILVSVFCELFSFLYCPKKWQKLFAIATLMIFPIGQAAGEYVLIFLLIPFLAYLTEENEINQRNLFPEILFILLFVTIPVPLELMKGTVYFITIDFLLKVLSLMAMAIYIFAIAIKNAIKR